MSKYRNLGSHLAALPVDTWEAGFDEIARILGFDLPHSASVYPAWWANQDPPHSQTRGWVDAGWRTAHLDLAGRRVSFARVDAPVAHTGQAKDVTSPPAIEPESAPAPDAAQSVEETEQLIFTGHATWRTLGPASLDSNGRLRLPAARSSPGLYRFTVRRGAAESIYVGETSNLSRRFAHYRNPGVSQATNIRLNAILKDALEKMEEVTVFIVIDSPRLSFGGQGDAADLASKPVRRLLESAALIVGGAIDVEQLNR